MSALPLGRTPLRVAWPDALTPGLAALGVALGVLLDSQLLLAVAAVAGTLWIVVYAPQVLLALLACQGTLKSLSPFDAVPVDLLPTSLALVGVACALHIRRHGLPRMPLAVLPMILLIVLLFFAAMRTTSAGGPYKAVYFAVVGLTLVLGALILIRDTESLVLMSIGFAGTGIVVALAAQPSVDPNLPLSLPGGNEITAGLYPAFGAIACLTCLAATTSTRLRLLALPVGVALAVAALQAGSRGVLLALIAATAVTVVVLLATTKRPGLTLVLAALVIVTAGFTARDVIGDAALQRYERLTTDPSRAYLRERALTQAIAHPLGSGIGAFGTNLPEPNPRPSVPYPHNVVLEVFDESGALALAALVALLACAALKAFPAARHPGWLFSGVALTFALVEASSSGDVNDNSVLWLSIGVALAASEATRNAGRASA